MYPYSSASPVVEQNCSLTMDAVQTTYCESSTVVSSMIGALVDMNHFAVHFLCENRDEEAFYLFESALSASGIDVQHVFGDSLKSFLSYIKASSETRDAMKPTQSATTTPHHVCTTSDQGFLQTIKTSQQQQECTNNSFQVFESAILFGEHFPLMEDNQAVAVLASHIAPVLLFNLGLMVHKRAATSGHQVLAHELYRMSLFLMEENTIQGLYCKSFDLVLLALFNNLCELNSSFYQTDRVALCREKFVAVFQSLDRCQIHQQDYAFFHEQLVFSVDLYPTAAAAA